MPLLFCYQLDETDIGDAGEARAFIHISYAQCLQLCYRRVM